MLRTATLVIVMAVVAGGPANSLACALWCIGQTNPDHHRSAGCHDVSTNAAGGQQLAAVDGCHDAVASAPFLAEARQTQSGPVATGATVPLADSIVSDIAHDAAAWRVFEARPPCAPARHIVLRI